MFRIRMVITCKYKKQIAKKCINQKIFQNELGAPYNILTEHFNLSHLKSILLKEI